ncbi:rod shape-determining protein MreD [Calidithermus terrae]|uniref:Rod shape-determining protein MreD n=1 Tax=Calidithermus terrae TaxID=1408545 RepID=A0A399ED06_9DEIN|nr:rod shape-determining protein MreD [Calidithermus terrae]RIH81423.1 rod shape-determining protein MreD [Calidithermus terrae]
MRAAILILVTFLLQGLISGLMPAEVAPPDLPFLAALALAGFYPLYVGLPLAFVIGILQDLLSAGYPGLHTVGLLCGVYVYYRLSRSFHSDELLGQITILGGSFLAKWLGYALVGYWLRGGPFAFAALTGVFVSEILLTLGLAPFLLGWARRVLGETRRE